MSDLESQIGQLFILGIKESEMTLDLEKFIKTFKPGGLVLFNHNLINKNQVRTLIQNLQAVSNVPLFICIDHEGGRIFRFPENFGITHYPNLNVFNQNSSPKDIGKMGYDYGYELNGLGINVNFAPVLDLSTNPDNTVTNDRSFGFDLNKVADFGKIFIKAMQSKGVSACAKHFPGIGEAIIDPHKSTSIISLSLEDLRKRELIPFVEAIKSGVHFIMPSHVYYEKIDEEKSLPATLSKKIITELLKENLGFKGLVVSDDMTMGAIMKRDKFEENCYRSFIAGVDLLLICWDSYNKAQNVFHYFINRYKKGDDLFKKRLHESSHKVMISKKKMRI